MMDLVSLVEKIPATFWGVIVGSLFTIIGVVLTNWSNAKRLRVQLEHDRGLKNRERDLSLRRDVYLAAAEAISAGMGAVGRFGDLSVSHEKLMQPFTEKAPAIAKVHIVANDNTIKAVVSFMEELTGIFLRLSSTRIKLGSLQQRLLFIQEQIRLASKERDRVVALMKELNLAGIHDQQRWAVVQHDFEFEGQRVDKLLKEQSVLQEELFPAQLRFVGECVAQIAVLNRLLTPVIGLVRAELELPFNESAYAEVVELSGRKQAGYFEQFLRDAAVGLRGPSDAVSQAAPNKAIEPMR